ncbi:Do family serine endopeptidase [Dysgonomonas sp. 25]|uniref:Do family serine endopeptidase n=1 Tax=Dysgonomonas sp. 25 TaxID=2302933 RepID=UPI0013D7821E|nr:Do family serine endopeptidase [Dysgonomonas sp. 25]NDV68004.1 Do family serine endopeptidase [Dysgonomonas sp. 25]
MKKILKSIIALVVVALVSGGVAWGTFHYLESKRGYDSSSDVSAYGQMFGQNGNLHLASLTQAGYPDFTKAAESSTHAVVHIKSIISKGDNRQERMIDPFEYFFGNPGGSRNTQPAIGYGSGVIISKDGYVITNNHVIDNANEIEVTLNDNTKYTAKLIGTDPTTDIALLKIEGKDFPYIPFGDSDNLKVGEWVLAVGNPFNLTSTVTAGIVSAKGRGGIGGGQESIQSYIQTDAAINRGNSGGALVNTDGQLVGINTAIYSQTGDFAGYGFAVPISIAGKVVADLKEYGTVQRAVLGVMIQDISVAKEVSPEKTKNIKVTEGAYVGGFADRSPAKQAGVQESDVIVAVNGTKVRNVGELQEQINRFRPGDKVKLDIIRNNAEKTFDVTLKNSEGSTEVVKKTDGLSAIGAAFIDLTDAKKKDLGISSGVEVAGVDRGGKFAQAGIQKGFIIQKINDQAVSSVKDVENLIQKASVGKDKVLFIIGLNSNGARRYYAIDLSE